MAALNNLINNCMATEVVSASQRIILEYENGSWSEEARLTGIFDSLKPATENLDGAVKKEEAISDLEAKDEARDKIVQDLYYVIIGYLRNPVAAISTAAETVNAAFSKYGVKIVKASYSNESGFISSMLKDFASDDLQSALAALGGVGQLITDLTTAENDFVNARLTYEREAAEDKNKESATKLKKVVVEIINGKLVRYLTGMSSVDDETYGQLARTIGKIIDDNNEAVKKRRGNNTPPEETEGE